MNKPTPSPRTEDSDEFTRFDRMTRALFKVDKRDVPKHEPRRRGAPSTKPTGEPQG